MAEEPLSEPPPARHAEIVPCVVALRLRHRLPYGTCKVKPVELLRWTRPGDPTQTNREQLARLIVRRLRGDLATILDEPTGVALKDGWEDRLITADASRVRHLLAQHQGRPLQQLTLLEVWRTLNVQLHSVLQLLARLEGIGWNPSTVKVPEPEEADYEAPSPPESRPATIAATDELREAAEKVLALPWLPQVADDLRFGHPGPGSAREWITSQLELAAVDARLPSLIEAITAAERSTFADEVASLAHAAVHHGSRRHGNQRRDQWVAMFLRRYVAPSGDGRTLQEVGDEFGITRERVRQVCEAILEVLRENKPAMPATVRVLRTTARVAPATAPEVNEQCARFLGDGAGIEAVLAFAKEFGLANIPVSVGTTTVRMAGSRISMSMIEPAAGAQWMVAALRHARRDCSFMGCSNLIRIAGLLSLREQIAPGQDALEAVLGGPADFRWLDKETGWFTFGDVETGSAAAARVRKIMAVASEPVSVDSIAAAFVTDDAWMYRDDNGRALAVPPVHVLRELFSKWSWLKTIQHNRFSPAEALGLDVLSDSERLAFEIIAAHGGVAAKFEIADRIVSVLGVSQMLVSILLGKAPFILKIEHGLYAVRGRRIDDNALANARRRLREKMGYADDVDAGDGFSLRITEASLRNEQFSVPAAFRQRLSGRKWRLVGLEGAAHVNQSGAMKGLNQHFKDARAGDSYLVLVGADELHVSLRKAREPVAVTTDTDQAPLIGNPT